MFRCYFVRRSCSADHVCPAYGLCRTHTAASTCATITTHRSPKIQIMNSKNPCIENETMKEVESQSTMQRSRITNGKPPKNVDGRSAWYRRKKDIMAGYLNELGGAEHVPVSVRLRVELVAGLFATNEETQTKICNGTDTAEDREFFRVTTGNIDRLVRSIEKDCPVPQAPKDIFIP